jgi:two-component system, chemotaxis family, chemotaxis protein CheY
MGLPVKHCLVVDDSRVIRKVACKILESLDFETDEAEDGIGALDACRMRMPELILLDWQMPNMSGVEFLRTLRREQNGTRPMVVFCTTENDIGHISEAMGAGANEYVMKPYDREILHAKLAQIGLV